MVRLCKKHSFQVIGILLKLTSEICRHLNETSQESKAKTLVNDLPSLFNQKTILHSKTTHAMPISILFMQHIKQNIVKCFKTMKPDNFKFPNIPFEQVSVHFFLYYIIIIILLRCLFCYCHCIVCIIVLVLCFYFFFVVCF